MVISCRERAYERRPPACDAICRESHGGEAARALNARGAVWNSFILAAHGTAVVARIRERFPQIVDQMIRALRLDAAHGTCALVDLYEHLAEVDFSRSVAQGAESALCVYTSPPCGMDPPLYAAPRRGSSSSPMVLAATHAALGRELRTGLRESRGAD